MGQRNIFYDTLPRKVWILLVISLLIRIAVFFRFQPWSPDVIQHQLLIFDSLGYHDLALSIKNHFSFCGDAFRTPGYPFFVAIVYSLLGEHPYTVLLVQIFLNLFSIVLMYKIGKELFFEKIGVFAAIVFSLDLHHLIFIYQILTETIYTTIFLLALLFYVKALKNKVSSALTGYEGKGLTISQKNGKIYVSLEESLLFASGSLLSTPKVLQP